MASVFGAKDCFTTPPTSEGTRVACAPRAPCRALSSAGARHQTLLRGLLGARSSTSSSRATSTPTAARRLEEAHQFANKCQHPRKLVQEVGQPAAPVCARFRGATRDEPSLTSFWDSWGLGGGLRDDATGGDGAAGPDEWAGDLPPGCLWGGGSREAPGSSAESMCGWWRKPASEGPQMAI